MDTPALLRRLVAFDTVSSRSNLELIGWVQDYLARHGARLRLTHNDESNKANLLASLGPDTAGGVVLSAHTDVVPVDDQDWDSDPFELTERDGRFFGRGTADMKGFIACCLAEVPRWATATLARPIHLALSYDEELGCLGVPRLIADMADNVPPPALAIVGEPTTMRLGRAHHGAFGFRTTFSGRAAHSSNPAAGISAIGLAAEFVRFLESAGANGDRQRAAFNIGRIAGGSAVNVISSRCEVEWMFRPAPEADADAIRRRIDAYLTGGVAAAPADTTALFAVPPLRAPPDSPAVEAARRLGGELPAASLAFGTEAGHFQKAGIPAVVCGPGSIDQAHQANEWIAVAELRKAERMMAAIGQWARTQP